MGRSKKLKFQDNASRKNVVQPGKDVFGKLKGRWAQSFFENENPIVLELACGRGEYTIGLAKEFPDRNFIGVDIKGSRIWTGSSEAELLGLTNVAFLRTKIQNLIEHFGPGDDIVEIWIVHPDPRPKKSDERRRLTNSRFLDMYKDLAADGSIIRVKTDDLGLYEYTLEVLEKRNDVRDIVCTEDLHRSNLLDEHYGITTRYENESRAEGRPITYLRFVFSKE